MESQKLSNWVQLITGLAVLGGLGLVVWELQQTRSLAQAQFAAEGRQELINDNRSFIGETFGDVYAKSCIEPTSLTDGEIVQLTQHFNTVYQQIRRLRDIRNIGGFDYSWESPAVAYVEYWLGNKVGRLYYERRKATGRIDPIIKSIADDFLANKSLKSDCHGLEDFIAKVRDASIQ